MLIPERGFFMFCGIIKNLGQFKDKKEAFFTFHAPVEFCKKINKGISVAVNGACLTVVNKTENFFSVEIMPETLQKTNLGKLKFGDSINLELPLTPQDFLSGHIIQGHVDAVTAIEEIKTEGNSKLLTVNITKKISKFIVEKGSIAINGVSLTVISCKQTNFTIGIIPYTLTYTNFKNLKVGDLVNIEVDILAKYLNKLQK